MRYIRTALFPAVLLTSCLLTSAASAMEEGAPAMPPIHEMIQESQAYVPAIIKGIRLYPDNPFRIDFIIDTGQSGLTGEELKKESNRLIKYFLAALTVPADDLWVNLSSYERDRIIPDKFGTTTMGRDLLTQDYILKQLTASLIYPEEEPGRSFWDRVYKKVYDAYGTTEIPVNTFNKIWIVPDKAVVQQSGDIAFITESHLNVMMEKDYLALRNNTANTQLGTDRLESDQVEALNDISSPVIKGLVLPEIEKEVNEGRHFAPLRQIYHSMILATWFKRNFTRNVLAHVYTDQNKTAGIETGDKMVKEKILHRYLEAFTAGVYDYIREDYDPYEKEEIPRRYFSGGFEGVAIERVLVSDQVGEIDLFQTARAEQTGTYQTISIYLDVVRNLDNLVNILRSMGASGMLADRQVTADSSEAEVMEAIIAYFQGRNNARTRYVNQEPDADGTVVVTLDERIKRTTIGRLIDQYVMSGPTGVKAINFQGTDGVWRIVGFSDDLPAQLDREQREVAYRRDHRLSALEATIRVMQDLNDERIPDLAEARRQNLRSARPDAQIAASVAVLANTRIMEEMKGFDPSQQRLLTRLTGTGKLLMTAPLLKNMGKVDESHLETKTLPNLPVTVMFNPRRNRYSRAEFWNRMKLLGTDGCTLCGVLKHHKTDELDLGNGFIVVPEDFPYFDNSFSVISKEHEAPRINAKLIKSMVQTLYELGPMGFRVGYNYRGVPTQPETRLIHQSYKVFQEELPIEKAPRKPILNRGGFKASYIDQFPFNAFVLETNRYDLLAFQIQNLERLLKLYNIPFYLLMSRSEDGTFQTFVILRSAKAPVASDFGDKFFGFLEAAGLVMFDLEEFMNRPSLHLDLLMAYKDIGLDKYHMEQLAYIYKAHYAMTWMAIEHGLQYEFDIMGRFYHTFWIPETGEVFKYYYYPTEHMDEHAKSWQEYFEQGYELARDYLGGIYVPMQNVDIDDHGRLVPLPPEAPPVYLIQKIAPGNNMAEHLDHLVEQLKDETEPSRVEFLIDEIVSLHERIIIWRARMLAAGIFDEDTKGLLFNIRGDAKLQGYDISHLIDSVSHSHELKEDIRKFEDRFNEHVKELALKSPVAYKALRKRFGNLNFIDEMKRLGLDIPRTEAERQSSPLQPMDSVLIKISRGEAVDLTAIKNDTPGETTTDEATNVGGIDLNPDLLDIQARGQTPLAEIPYDAGVYETIPIKGLTPVIFRITPTDFSVLPGVSVSKNDLVIP